MGRAFDVVLYGATGYTGKLIAAYLNETYQSSVRWAIAGRTQAKVQAVLDTLDGASAAGVQALAVALDDDAAVEALVGRTRVIIAAAGPFCRHGEPLVRACAKLGTDYVDITGEATWVKDMGDKYGRDARASGALIVPMCGFDSVPSDITAFYAASQIREATGRPAVSVNSVLTMKGGMSGGTLHTVMANMEDMKDMKAASDLHLLTPESADRPTIERDYLLPRHIGALRSYMCPFFLSVSNTRVVRATAGHLQLSEGYVRFGAKFSYQEGIRARSLALALTTAFFYVLSMALAFIRPTRYLLRRFVLPPPGSGPSPKALAAGSCRVHVVAKNDRGVIRTYRFLGQEPYLETARLVSECAMVLVESKKKTPAVVSLGGGGFYTPAAAFGDRLIERITVRGVILQPLDPIDS